MIVICHPERMKESCILFLTLIIDLPSFTVSHIQKNDQNEKEYLQDIHTLSYFHSHFPPANPSLSTFTIIVTHSRVYCTLIFTLILTLSCNHPFKHIYSYLAQPSHPHGNGNTLKTWWWLSCVRIILETRLKLF